MRRACSRRQQVAPAMSNRLLPCCDSTNFPQSIGVACTTNDSTSCAQDPQSVGLRERTDSWTHSRYRRACSSSRSLRWAALPPGKAAAAGASTGATGSLEFGFDAATGIPTGDAARGAKSAEDICPRRSAASPGEPSCASASCTSAWPGGQAQGGRDGLYLDDRPDRPIGVTGLAEETAAQAHTPLVPKRLAGLVPKRLAGGGPGGILGARQEPATGRRPSLERGSPETNPRMSSR